MTTRLFSAVVAGLFSVISGHAFAQVLPPTSFTSPVKPGFWYLSFGGYGAVQDLPSYTHGTMAFGPSAGQPGLEFDSSAAGPGVAGVVGYAIDRAGGIWGERPRVEVGLSAFFGSGSSSAFRSVTGADHLLSPITTPVGVTAFTGGGADFYGKLKLHDDEVDTTLRFKTDFTIAPNFVMSPFVGIIGGDQETQYEMTFNAVSNTAGFQPYSGSYKQDIHAYHFGGEIGTGLSYWVTPNFSLNGNVAVGLFRRWATLHSGGGINFHTFRPYYTPDVSGDKTGVRVSRTRQTITPVPPTTGANAPRSFQGTSIMRLRGDTATA